MASQAVWRPQSDARILLARKRIAAFPLGAGNCRLSAV